MSLCGRGNKGHIASHFFHPVMFCEITSYYLALVLPTSWTKYAIIGAEIQGVFSLLSPSNYLLFDELLHIINHCRES